MKTTIRAGIFLLLALSWTPAFAEDSIVEKPVAEKPILANPMGHSKGTFALGLQLGAADGQDGSSGFSGLTVRFGRDRSIEGILAFNGGGSWIVNGNFLLHSSSLIEQYPLSSVKLYCGVGVGAWTGGDGGIWAQVPLGIDFAFMVPIEASIYIAPGLDIQPSVDANVHFGLGARYWFM